MKIKITGKIEYKAKSVGVFTTRQLVAVAVGIAVGVCVYLPLSTVLPAAVGTVAALAVAIAVIAVLSLEAGGIPLSALARRFVALAVGHGNRKYVTEDIFNEKKEK